jgi:autotransporter-associated beta strand protein
MKGLGITLAAVPAALSLLPLRSVKATVFASQIDNYAPGTLDSFDSYYEDTTDWTGIPSGTTGAPEGFPGVVSAFFPPFDVDQVLEIGIGGRLELQFPEPINVTFAPAIGVFTNAGLVDSNYPSGTASDPATTFGSGEADVRVSQDGTTWVDLGLQNLDNPQNYYANAEPYDFVPPTEPQLEDYGKPFAGNLDSFDGESYSQIIATLDGSAGGTWLNLSASGLSQVNFIEFCEPNCLPEGSHLGFVAVSANDNDLASPPELLLDDSVPAADTSITLNYTVTPGQVVIDSVTNNFTFSGSGGIAGTASLVKCGSSTLTMNIVNNYTGGTTISAGALIVGKTGALPAGEPVVNNGNLVINANTVTDSLSGNGALIIGAGGAAIFQLTNSSGVSQQASLMINAGSTLDIANNAFVLNYSGASPEAGVQQFIENGQNAAINNGRGDIISTYAAGIGLDVGYVDGADGIDSNLNAGQLLIEPALPGDTDLDGIVNIRDLQNLLGDFNQPGFWDQGNFNGHADVDISDLQTLLANFNASTDLADVQSIGIANLLGQFNFVTTANPNGKGFTLSAVPEPTIAVWLFLSAFVAARRRRPARLGIA